MKRVNIHLSERHIEFLKRHKKETGMPGSELIRRLLDERESRVDSTGGRGTNAGDSGDDAKQ
jgi:hypothetical protein